MARCIAISKMVIVETASSMYEIMIIDNCQITPTDVEFIVGLKMPNLVCLDLGIVQIL